MTLALSLDNVGSGLYLPVAALFLIQVQGLSVASAGLALGIGTAVGLSVPALAGVLVERIGPRYVLAAGLALQALAMAAFLFLPGWWGALVASAIFSSGMQMFYGSLFALLSTLPQAERSHDRYFALVDMVRSGAFGLGALLGAGILAWYPDALAWLLIGNLILSAFSALVVLFQMSGGLAARPHETPIGGEGNILKNRPFMGLILLCFLVAIIGDFFPLTFPVIAVEQLAAPAWLPSLCIALLTLTSSTLTVTVVHLTRSRSRAFVVTLGLIILISWIGVMVATYFTPTKYVSALLLLSTLIFAVGSLLIGTRLNAAAHDAAPSQYLGRYLATFQYAFSLASLTAPLLLAAFALATWLPWLLLLLAAAMALALIPVLGRALPSQVLRASIGVQDTVVSQQK